RPFLPPGGSSGAWWDSLKDSGPSLPNRLPGTGAEKSGVCPALEVDLNCTQECPSGGECAADLKCCQASCATVCQMPSGNPRGLHQAGRETVLHASGQLGCCHNGCRKVSCVTIVF
uniref:WAP domain-containing protein n=1 Tax=Monodon monoceros TaxID=40151 RepID=A0A8C6AUY4_MONMO